jgi:heptosyltransferase-1
VIEIYLDVAAALGAATRPVQFPNLIRRARFSEVEEVLRKRGWEGEKGLVVVNPAAGWPSKEWPLARSVQVVRNIASKQGMQPVVLCGPDRAQEVREICGSGLIVLAGDLSLGQLPALFAKCSLYIGYDTGPTHIAAAVGSKVICIMGPTDPARNGPYGGNAITLWRCRKPRGCWVRRCNQRCIDDVTNEAVLRAADLLLGATTERKAMAR